MKKTCIQLLTFHGEDYHMAEQYLTSMLTQGWKLRWCKGIFASFEKTENLDIRYVVDPYAITSPMNMKRFPKYRLNEYMSNGWYALSRNRGTYIFYTDNPNAERPALEENMRTQVKHTCGLSSFFLAILLLVALCRCFTVPAVVYSILLTDIYIVITATVAFLIIYHIVNAALLLFVKTTSKKKLFICKRYIIHDSTLFLLLLSVIFLESRQQQEILLYLLLPICVVIIGTIIMKFASIGSKDAKDSNRRLIPVVCIIAASLLILIPTSFGRLQSSSNFIGQQRQADLLAMSNQLPVLHLQDITAVTNVTSAIKENNSILGENMLYAEESGTDLSIFTNRSHMKNDFLASHIFHYLYIQAQVDFQETFQQKQYKNITYYKLEKANTYLLQKNALVYLCTIPQNININHVLELLMSYTSTPTHHN